MKKAIVGIAALLLTVSPFAATADGLRQNINFNRSWKFELANVPDGEAVKFDDSHWQDVNVPHTFSLPYFGWTFFYEGYGWYRKHFNVPLDWSDKRVNLEFDAAFRVAEVYINGVQVGVHKGGYTGFSMDITDAIHAGDNVVAVRLNNLWNAQIAPRAGEHNFSGGIYRDVRMVVTAPLHVTWYGTWVTTPQVSKDSGTVNVKTEVQNDFSMTKTATVQTAIIDGNGNTVARFSSSSQINAHSVATFDQTLPPVAKPQLWSPDRPYLYSVKTTVLDGSTPVDDYVSPLGFRWFKFTAKEGFFLNGEHVYLYGANVHQDHAGWGDAVADSGFFRDVSLVKGAGFNFIRGSHYPHSPAFVDACDRLGVMFWSENCFWGIGGFSRDGYWWTSSAYPPDLENQPAFEASVKQQLIEMIRIHRNHPSIIAWSMCNEPFFSYAFPKVRSFLQQLVALSHELDPTRPAGIGGCQRPEGGSDRIDNVGDIAGYNGDGASEAAFQDPGFPSLITEYGSVACSRPGKYDPGWSDSELIKSNGQPVYPWRSGQCVWCMFDHGSVAGRGLGNMGLVDYFRIPKRAWYWYRNAYRHIPPPAWPAPGKAAALVLSTDKTVLKSADGTDDAQIVVTVVDKDGKPISNTPQVKLAIESGPGEFPTGPDITFVNGTDIHIDDGEAAIEFRSYYGGKTVLRATSPGLKDATLELTTLGEPQFVQGTTPAVKPRPYTRFPDNGDVFHSSIRIGIQNPAFASSAEPSHGCGLANDGDPATYWQAQAADANPWWQVDVEKVMSIESAKIQFPWDGDWSCIAEVSADGKSGWKPMGVAASDAKGETFKAAGDGVTGRFMRIRFTHVPAGKPAAISEVEVRGKLSTN